MDNQKYHWCRRSIARELIGRHEIAQLERFPGLVLRSTPIVQRGLLGRFVEIRLQLRCHLGKK